MRSRLDVTMVKAHNRRLVFREVTATAPTTRAVIASNTHLSVGTVATILDELTAEGVVRQVKDARRPGGSAVGRKPHRVEFLPKSKRILCVDLATNTPTYCVKDLSLTTELSRHVGGRETSRASYERRLRDLLDDIGKLSRDSSAAGEPARPIIGVGVSVPGPYRPAEDRVSCKLIPALNDIHLQSLFREYVACPVLIDHDVKLALGTEIRLIPDYERKTIVSIFLGEGVGSAISINGMVFGGAHEFAGEIGQMHIVEGGTLEDQISWTSFVADVDMSRGLDDIEDEKPFLEELRRRYDAGDGIITKRLDRTIHVVARAVANMICVLNPHEVIVGGRYAVFGERFARELQAATELYLIDELKRDLRFVLSGSSENEPLIGAADLVREHWLDHHHIDSTAGPIPIVDLEGR